MLELLTQKIGRALRNLGNKGKLKESDIDEALREIRLALLEADVNFKVVKTFLGEVRPRLIDAEVIDSLTPLQQAVQVIQEELVKILGQGAHPLATSGKSPSILMLVGLQGSGKTTTAAKLALKLKESGKSVALVAADLGRPAAVEQLKILGKRLGITVYSESKESDPVSLCLNAIKASNEELPDWLIIDTQGRLHVDEGMMSELIGLKKKLEPVEVLLVVDAMSGQDAVKAADEFKNKIGLTGLVLTKMDGDARGGAALSITYVSGVPIRYIGIGEKPEALELYYPERLASRILGMGDMLTLIEKAQMNIDENKAKELEKKIRSDNFTLDDFLWQLNQVKKMGSLSQLVQMIPGFSQFGLKNLGNTEEKSLKKIEAIILSMTGEEREDPSIIAGSRKKRIARGSGTTPQDVNQLLSQFQQVKKIAGLLKQGKLPKKDRFLKNIKNRT